MKISDFVDKIIKYGNCNTNIILDSITRCDEETLYKLLEYIKKLNNNNVNSIGFTYTENNDRVVKFEKIFDVIFAYKIKTISPISCG